MASRLTVVTGPPGVDIGPATAKLAAAIRLDDGLAVRVVRTGRYGPIDQPHASPDPHHRQEARPGSIGAVLLDVLPSAWQDPQTNLAVVFDGAPVTNLADDMRVLNALGLNPAHRLTVQSNIGSVAWVPPPVEVGDVGVHARDAVLRAGGRVLIEAGDGQTLLEALATVGIPPWAEWIDHLDRWIVLDVRHGMTADDVAAAVGAAVNEFDGSSGAYGNTGQPPTLRVALMNTQFVIPGLAGHDYNVATDEGDALDQDTAGALVSLLDAILERSGVEVHLIGTGRIDGTGVWSWVESGEYAETSVRDQ
jgi:hypothetical protein